MSLLTLTGPSGIGKTRLARQVLAQMGPTYGAEGGAWFVSLEGCGESAEVEAAVARALAIGHAEGEALAAAIDARGRTLLVLDNLDSVAAEIGGVLEGWLDRCPELQLVTTSIASISVEGEVRVELGPLEPSDAITLYLERAHRAWAGREFPEAERVLIEELVRRLDRIPLAIELAAARIRVLPPRALLSRFGERLELLSSTKQGRHGSLLRALTLTWELLSKEEQLFLAQASVFEGGFTWEAAVGVLGGASEQERESLDLLDALRAKALLAIDDSEDPRFSLFEIVRDYAGRELRRLGLESDCVLAHARYFVSEGERRAAQLEGDGAQAAIRWLKAERENLVAAHLRCKEIEPALAARAGLVLAPLLALEGHAAAEIHFLEGTVQAARASGEAGLLFQSLGDLAKAILPHGRSKEAIASLEEALEIARAQGERVAEGHLLVHLASTHLRRAELGEASAALELALRIGAEEGAPLLEGSAWMMRGAVSAGTSLDDADRLYARALEIFRSHGFIRREALTLTWAAGIWVGQGRFREARLGLHDALEAFRSIGNRAAEANVLMTLGGAELAAGRLQEARAWSLESLELQRQLGNLRGEGIVNGNLGFIALELGELERAEARLSAAVRILDATGDRRFLAATLPFLAVLEARQGQLREGRRSLAEAKAFFEGVGDEASLSVARILEGCVELAEARALPPTARKAAEGLADLARARLSGAFSSTLSGADCRFEAVRLLEQDLAAWDDAPVEIEAEAPAAKLSVAADGSWFEVEGEVRVDLRRRVAIRRMLGVLAKKRLADPGVGIPSHELFELGWRGESILPEAATRRVYFSVWTLRELGLEGILLNQTDGYLLDPKVELVLGA